MYAQSRHAFEGMGQPGSSSKPSEPHLTAALGTMWAHAVNTRLVLETAAGVRYIKVSDCMWCYISRCQHPLLQWVSVLSMRSTVPVHLSWVGLCSSVAEAHESLCCCHCTVPFSGQVDCRVSSEQVHRMKHGMCCQTLSVLLWSSLACIIFGEHVGNNTLLCQPSYE